MTDDLTPAYATEVVPQREGDISIYNLRKW